MKNDAHYDRPEIYDQFYGPLKTLPDWFMKEISGKPEILELACGTGRLSIPLSQSPERSVTGLDISEGMLNLARKKADGQKVNVEWVQGDMRQFELNRKFDTILLLFNSISHLHRRTDVEDCLSCVKNHLRSNGVFVISAFVPAVSILNRDPEIRQNFMEYIDPDNGKTVQVTDSYRYDPSTQISHITHYDGDSDHVIGGLNMKKYFPQELESLLHYNKFQIDKIFGSWDQDEFGEQSDHQIIFAKKMS
ncbi:MAG: class I SAM-dependent methyltransferase [Verrucomicrobiales bacterium]|nr:class I SAM-dependent methyltransferase [Verrucomicrobiales bacterium]